MLLRKTAASFPRGRADTLPASAAGSAHRDCPGRARQRPASRLGGRGAPPPRAPRNPAAPGAPPALPAALPRACRSRRPGEVLWPPRSAASSSSGSSRPPASPPPHRGAHSQGGGERGAVRNGHLRGGGVRARGGRGARAAGRAPPRAAHQPDRGGGGALRVRARPPPPSARPWSARGAVGARGGRARAGSGPGWGMPLGAPFSSRAWGLHAPRLPGDAASLVSFRREAVRGARREPRGRGQHPAGRVLPPAAPCAGAPGVRPASLQPSIPGGASRLRHRPAGPNLIDCDLKTSKNCH